MTVIVATSASLAAAILAWLAARHLARRESTRSAVARGAASALAVVALTWAVVTLSLAVCVSNTPLTDGVVNVYRSVAGGYHESKNVPEDDGLRGAVLIYYKPGCADCEAIWDALSEALVEADRPDVYLINTRSPTGRALLEKYPVKEVPAGVYVARADNNTDAFRENLFTTTEDGTRFRWEALNFLLRCQAQGW